MGLEEIRKLKSGLPKQPKPKKPIAKKSAKKLKQEAEEKKGKKDPSAEKERWFQDRRGEMSGFCKNCNRPSFKNSNEYFRFSIAHILAKRKSMFPSVGTHPENWVELCGDCHQNLDNCMIDLLDLSCWDEVITKFVSIYPSIANEERKRIPDVLLQYVKNETDVR